MSIVTQLLQDLDCSSSWRKATVSCRALSLDGWRHVTFIDDGLGALTALRGVASLNLQGCTTLTDKGLEAIAHMTSLTSVNLQDCRQISGVSLREPDTSLDSVSCEELQHLQSFFLPFLQLWAFASESRQ